MMSRLSCILVILFAHVAICSAEPVFTKLNEKSRLKGTLVENKYEAYKGIRYAQPPIDKHRFKAPIPYAFEEELMDVTQFGSVCPQLTKSKEDVIGKEDCLFLNVFVPKAFRKEGLLPVMVYFHGGSFTVGDTIAYGPDYFMSQGGVILVTVNYRLGALGFLSLEDDTISGNMGLKDQLESLRWVKKHISSFGGDEGSITIFGNSAGGISVLSLMMASQEETGLFHKAISQSGPVIDGPFMHSTHKPFYYASVYANELGCESETTLEMQECLQEIQANELILKQNIFEKLFEVPNPWKPVEDFDYASKPLFKESFLDTLKSGRYRKVPLLMGGTSEECAYMSEGFFQNDEEMFQEISENFDILGVTLLMGIDEADVTEEDSATANIINLEYFNKDNITYSSDNLDKLLKMLTDVHFLAPVDRQVQLIANSSEEAVYYYNYRHRGAYSTGLQGLDLGTSHADELFLLFKMKEDPLTLEDRKVSESLIAYWTSFASTGKPSPLWKPVSNAISPKYAILDSSMDLSVKRELYFSERMAFIASTNDIIKSYRNFDLESHPAIRAVMDREVEPDEVDEEEPHREEL